MGRTGADTSSAAPNGRGAVLSLEPVLNQQAEFTHTLAPSRQQPPIRKLQFRLEVPLEGGPHGRADDERHAHAEDVVLRSFQFRVRKTYSYSAPAERRCRTASGSRHSSTTVGGSVVGSSSNARPSAAHASQGSGPGRLEIRTLSPKGAPRRSRGLGTRAARVRTTTELGNAHVWIGIVQE